MDIKVNKTFNYLKEEKGLNITKRTIRRVYYEILKIISKYFKNIYQSVLLGNFNANNYFSIDESLINHYHGKQVWLIGMTDNINKGFSIEGSLNKISENMKAFITQ